MAFTATKDLMLPATVTGSWPRPRWYTQNMWGRPLDTAMMDPWYREQFTDAHAIVVSDQARAGLDILTTGDYHLDEDVAGPLVAPLPAAALEGPRARGAADREHPLAAALLPGRHDARLDLQDLALAARGRQGRARPEEPARVREDLAHRAASRRRRGQAGQVRHVLGAGAGVLPRQPHAAIRPRRQEAADLGHGRGDEPRAAPARRLGLQGDPGRGADAAFHGPLLPGDDGVPRLPRRLLQPRDRGARRRRGLDPHLLGQPEHAEGLHRRVLRELDRDLPRAAQGRRLDDRGDRERLQGAAAVRALQGLAEEEDRRRRHQPPHAAGGLPGRRRRPHPPLPRSTFPPTSWCSRPTAASAGRASTATSPSTRRRRSRRRGTSCSRSSASRRATSRPRTRSWPGTSFPTTSRSRT